MASQTASPGCGKRPMRSLVWCAAMISIAALDAGAQQPDQLQQLQQQLQQLKQQYADTTREFEQRIAALEQQLEKQKTAAEMPKKVPPVPVLELVAEKAAKKAVDDVWAR